MYVCTGNTHSIWKFLDQGLSQLWPTPQVQQPQILNPLCWAGDWTITSKETNWIINPLDHSSNSSKLTFLNKNMNGANHAQPKTPWLREWSWASYFPTSCLDSLTCKVDMVTDSICCEDCRFHVCPTSRTVPYRKSYVSTVICTHVCMFF